jgi:hypothetical protein
MSWNTVLIGCAAIPVAWYSRAASIPFTPPPVTAANAGPARGSR